MRRVLVAVALAGVLAGCGTLWMTAEESDRRAVERAAQRERDEKENAGEVIKTYGPMCEALGYQRDSDGWRGCILSRYNAERARSSGEIIPIFTPPPRVNCTRIGNVMTCN